MTPNSVPVRILLADDSELMRTALSALLREQAGWQICGEAAGGLDAIQKSILLRPDVILVDVSMPDLNGFKVAARVHEQLPDSRILIVTEHDALALAHIGPQPGVSGYVMKSRLSFDLVPAVKAIVERKSLSKSAST